jgi:SAM-dependent methyltransferase
MRHCVICDSTKRELLWRSDFLVPDGWPRPKYLDWFRCACGMIYGDNETVTDQDYTKYYVERYGYGVNDYEQGKRMMDRAHYIAEKYKDKNIKIVDFGGGDGGLSSVLERFGFKNAKNVGAGDEMPEGVDVVLAEHVLEHIYSMNIAMSDITSALKEGGMLVVDIPDGGAISFVKPAEMPILDYTQVHINHFRVVDMLRLMERWGFELLETHEYTERFMPCRMFVFVKGADIGWLAREYVIANIEEKQDKLRAIGDTPVIVWGLGDIAMHLLARYPINVKYFVCNDPAFKDQTIGKIPILEAPISEHPIVVMAQAQKDKLIEHIKSVCSNEIIVI